jgi:hypothetical protein
MTVDRLKKTKLTATVELFLQKEKRNEKKNGGIKIEEK